MEKTKRPAGGKARKMGGHLLEKPPNQRGDEERGPKSDCIEEKKEMTSPFGLTCTGWS